MATLLEMLTGQTAADVLGGVGQIALGRDVSNDILGAAQQANQSLFNAGQQARQNLEFRPFTITSGTGAQSTVGPQGNISFGLSPQEQAIQSQGLSGALSFLQGNNPLAGQAGQLESMFSALSGQFQPNINQAAGDIYSQIRAMQSPEEERARLALENRLQSQGRLGLRTSMFGGSPEALALEKAIQEQQAGTAFQARNQALGEQGNLLQSLLGLSSQGANLRGQQQQLAQGMLGLGYAPETQAINRFQPAINIADIMQTLQRQGVGTEAQLQQSGIEALMQGQQLRTGLFGSLLGGVLDDFTAARDDQSTLLGSLLGSLGGALGGQQQSSIAQQWSNPTAGIALNLGGLLGGLFNSNPTQTVFNGATNQTGGISLADSLARFGI